MRRLLEAGVTIHSIDAICYSHFHPDHTAELIPFLFASKYPDEDARTRRLILIAGHGFGQFFNNLKAVYGDWMALKPGLLDLVEIHPQDPPDANIFIGSILIEACAVTHRPESLAYAVNLNNSSRIVYSGDTDFCENLVAFSRGADLLICEAATPNGYKVKGHLTPSLAGEIARRAGVKRLVLTHFYPVCDQVDIEKQCRTTYEGPLIIARDLMRIDLGDR
jgi:ribonuclease BN (tRNA processing enzyme)